MTEVMLALDNELADRFPCGFTEEVLHEFQRRGVNWVKIGWQSSFAENLLKICHSLRLKIMWDMKIWDTVDTVTLAVHHALAYRGISIISVFPDEQVIKAAVTARDHYGQGKIVIPLQLTDRPIEPTHVLTTRFIDCFDWGVDGVVCAGSECDFLRKFLIINRPTYCYWWLTGKAAIDDSPMFVCPGIRRKDTDPNNHQRYCTPEVAISNRASFVVLGRILATADDPLVELERIVALLT
jgi:orotidine-5'-phosphate decarboxylase